MNRGAFTEEIKRKYNIAVEELRLIPYFQYLLCNNKPVDPTKLSQEEHKILQKWRDEGKISFSMSNMCTCTKDFWDWMNEVLWDSYIPHLDKDQILREKSK